jgi:hypothetical protein
VFIYLDDKERWVWRDDEHRDAAVFKPLLIFAEKRVPADFTIDLSSVNDGNWNILCLASEYGYAASALSEMRKKHGLDGPIEISRSTESKIGMSPPCCTGMAFTDRKGQLHFLRLTGEFVERTNSTGTEACFLREHPIWRLSEPRLSIR